MSFIQKKMKVYEEELKQLISDNQILFRAIDKANLEIENIYQEIEMSMMSKIKQFFKK